MKLLIESGGHVNLNTKPGSWRMQVRQSVQDMLQLTRFNEHPLNTDLESIKQASQFWHMLLPVKDTYEIYSILHIHASKYQTK